MLTAHAGLAIRQPCDRSLETSWWIGNKNCQILRRTHSKQRYMNDHTIIDWMLLNFTQVIQQNCCQPGRKFEKSFCAVDRLSCQLELSKSETSQFRSGLVFDIVIYVHVIFLHGVVLRYLTSSDFCVAKFLWASNMPEPSRCWQHHSI